MKPRVMIVGAFPPPGKNVFGGWVTDCAVLMRSSLPERVDVDPFDSTQATNPPPSLPVRALLAVRRTARYLWRVERRRPDAIILFAGIGASLIEKGAMAWYARLRGVPALMFPRGGSIIDACDRSRFTRWWVRLAFGGARKILCQSDRWQRFGIGTLGFRPQDAPPLPNFTASNELLAIGEARVTRDDAPRLLFVGWLDREKGVQELLDACRAIADTHVFTLRFVGEGNHSDAARRVVAASGLESRVTFSGWLRGAALQEAFASADVFVLPSWEEGLPNAMVEAMATRLAVVVTAVGSIPDVVVHETDALLIPPKDTNSLSAALRRIIEDVPLRRQLADGAFATARRSFGVEPAVGQLVASVEHAIGGR